MSDGAPSYLKEQTHSIQVLAQREKDGDGNDTNHVQVTIRCMSLGNDYLPLLAVFLAKEKDKFTYVGQSKATPPVTPVAPFMTIDNRSTDVSSSSSQQVLQASFKANFDPSATNAQFKITMYATPSVANIHSMAPSLSKGLQSKDQLAVVVVDLLAVLANTPHAIQKSVFTMQSAATAARANFIQSNDPLAAPASTYALSETAARHFQPTTQPPQDNTTTQTNSTNQENKTTPEAEKASSDSAAPIDTTTETTTNSETGTNTAVVAGAAVAGGVGVATLAAASSTPKAPMPLIRSPSARGRDLRQQGKYSMQPSKSTTLAKHQEEQRACNLGECSIQ